MSGLTKKNSAPYLQYFIPPSSADYTKEISNNTKENFESQYFDASFDIHIAIYIFDTCRMAYVSNMAFLAFLT